MKSRTILKYQYDELGEFLATQYVKKNKLVEKHDEAQKKIDEIMSDNLPELVKEAYKKYPEYFVLGSYDCLLSEMYDAQTREGRRGISGTWYPQYRIDVANDFYDFLKEKDILKDISGWCHYSANTPGVSLCRINFIGLQVANETSDYYKTRNQNFLKCIKYMYEHKPIIDVIKDYMVEYAKYMKFCKQLSCAFGTITTTNMLKNEIPEAYDFFYKKYGAQYEKEDAEEKERKKKEKKAQCDQIEGLRAAIQ